MPSDWPYPRWIAHRGGALLAPENTLAAVDEAARRGYRAVEVDVQLTADGIPVLMHDDTLVRTAGGSGLVASTPAADLAGLDAGGWFAPRFAGTRIPTLEQALERFQRHGMQALIELKAGEGQDPSRLGRVVARTVARCWQPEPPLLISFSPEALVAAASEQPGIPRALLLDSPWRPDWRDAMRAAQATSLDVDHGMLTRDRVAEVRDAGVRLVAWTVNRPERATQLLEWGVDGITTDAIDRMGP